MTVVGDRSSHPAGGIFDVRDSYREQQIDDGQAARVPGPVHFAVTALVTPAGRVETSDWRLETRRTLSGLSVFLDRVVQGRRAPVVRTLPASTTDVKTTVSSPGFQDRAVTFQPGSGQRLQVNLEPAVDYPFGRVTTRPDEQPPSLLRGSVRDEPGDGVPDADVATAQALYGYRTAGDGAWVLVLPDDIAWPAAGLQLTVSVTLTPVPGRWQSATVLPDANGPSPWTGDGLVKTCPVTAQRGVSVSVPGLRLRLT